MKILVYVSNVPQGFLSKITDDFLDYVWSVLRVRGYSYKETREGSFVKWTFSSSNNSIIITGFAGHAGVASTPVVLSLMDTDTSSTSPIESVNFKGRSFPLNHSSLSEEEFNSYKECLERFKTRIRALPSFVAAKRKLSHFQKTRAEEAKQEAQFVRYTDYVTLMKEQGNPITDDDTHFNWWKENIDV